MPLVGEDPSFYVAQPVSFPSRCNNSRAFVPKVCTYVKCTFLSRICSKPYLHTGFCREGLEGLYWQLPPCTLAAIREVSRGSARREKRAV